jgi:hypothetical protein
MFRFTIKSLIFITTVVATYGLVISSARDGTAWKCFAGFALLASLIGGKIAYDENMDRKAILRDGKEGAKLPE